MTEATTNNAQKTKKENSLGTSLHTSHLHTQNCLVRALPAKKTGMRRSLPSFVRLGLYAIKVKGREGKGREGKGREGYEVRSVREDGDREKKKDAPHVHHRPQSNMYTLSLMLPTHEQPPRTKQRAVPCRSCTQSGREGDHKIDETYAEGGVLVHNPDRI